MGFINYFYKLNKTQVLVIKLNYVNSYKIILKLVIWSKPSIKYFIKLSTLKHLTRTYLNLYLVLSTSQGLLTHNEAINKNTSGYLLYTATL